MNPRIVLVVDDDQSVRTSLSRMLTVRGYLAVPAATVEETLRQLEIVRPDVILMDLQLSGSSGVVATRTIKSMSALCDIPVIALSATPSLDEESRALFAAILRKPCPSAEILAAIEHALRS